MAQHREDRLKSDMRRRKCITWGDHKQKKGWYFAIKRSQKGHSMRRKSEFNHIGVVESGDEKEAKVRIFPEFCDGLKGINQFSHIIVLYWFHSRDKAEERRTLQVSPRRHALDVKVGVFACRSPSRPNPIGLCVVELTKVEECVLTVKGLDAFVGSPIVDIKPYLPRADSIPDARVPEWTLHGPPT